MYFISAFLVGFLGSFHCAGMCGPIALALPRAATPAGSVTGRFLYNAGRILTYGAMGLAAGLLGHLLAISGFQKALSIGAGLLILVVAGISYLAARPLPSPGIARLASPLKKKFAALFGRRTLLTFLSIGLLNGLLPCGFVYLALAAAAAAGTVTGSVTYMLWFGLGTVPMMLFLSLAGNFFGLRFRRLVNRLTPVVAVAVAALLIYRGLSMTGAACHHGAMH
jgi:sulfite exporter TauE/SafE